jgi:hypothetical protein
VSKPPTKLALRNNGAHPRKPHRRARARVKSLPASRSERWKNRFIVALSKVPSLKYAAKVAHVGRSKVYSHRKTDPEFAERLKEALDFALDDIESRCFEIALGRDGVKYDAAKISLMTWLLRCHRPRPYDPINKSEVGLLGGIVFLPQKKEGAE